ncbi:MAG: hypothetical protein K2P58_10630 [Hyphomonadaceae bacterium]|nr:hypothetical protein [Hyphomonadaceae bacterium]
MGSTTSKLVALAALLQLLVAIPALTSPPEPGSFSVMGIEGGPITHWAFNTQTGLWPAIYLLALAIGLEVLQRIAHAVEQAAVNEEQ